MSHLSLEMIARLVDEQPTPLDAAHLNSCATCRRELEEMRADIATLGELEDIHPSPDAWDTIEARLEAEGLLRPALTIRPRARSYFVPLSRAAAVAFIFMGGALAGRAFGGPTGVGNTPQNLAVNGAVQTATDSNATSGIGANAGDAGASPASAGPAGAPALNTATQPVVETPRNVRLASTGTAQRSDGARTGTSNVSDSDAALRSLRDAEDKYFSALSRYSEKAGTEASDPNARLAALEGIVLTTKAALAQAPTDPVINGYHLTALAQRDAMLKQVRAASPTTW
jgi:hypothetical protein